MALFRDPQTSRLAAKEILYKDPFSEGTHRLRKRMVFVALLAVLNSYFPLDLSQSTALGLKFKDSVAPSLAGVLGVWLIMMAAVWLTYSIQELSAWWSQGRESLFLDFATKLEKLSDRDKEIVDVIEKGLGQLDRHYSALEELRDESASSDSTHESREKVFHDETVRMENWLRSISEYAKAYDARVTNAADFYNRLRAELRAVIFAQVMRIGVVEIGVPFCLVVWGTLVSSSEVIDLVTSVIH
jgi:hypothetical protein